jgi:hypothetical protein
MKNLSRESILRMVDRMINTSNTTTENLTTENRSSGTQEQTRKGPDMETRLKDLEELTAKLEERISKLESLHNQK